MNPRPDISGRERAGHFRGTAGPSPAEGARLPQAGAHSPPGPWAQHCLRAAPWPPPHSGSWRRLLLSTVRRSPCQRPQQPTPGCDLASPGRRESAPPPKTVPLSTDFSPDALRRIDPGFPTMPQEQGAPAHAWSPSASVQAPRPRCSREAGGEVKAADPRTHPRGSGKWGSRCALRLRPLQWGLGGGSALLRCPRAWRGLHTELVSAQPQGDRRYHLQL